MAFMTLTERAKVWNSLDDNLREKIRKGELSIEEAAQYVVPIGDKELARARVEYPTNRGNLAPGSIDPGEVDPLATPSGDRNGWAAMPANDEYGFGTMLDVDATRAGRSIDAFGAGANIADLEANRRAGSAADQSFGQTLTERLLSRGRAATDRLRDPSNLANPVGLFAEGMTGLTASMAEAVQDEVSGTFSNTEERAKREQAALARLAENIQQINSATARLKEMPQNPYTAEFTTAWEGGDWAGAAMAAPLAVGSTLGEQGIELAAQTAAGAGVAYVTKNPRAAIAAGRALAAAGASTEYGSDLGDLWDAVPEDQRTYEKFKEIQEIAQQSSLARGIIEAALPGYGAKFGDTAVKRAAIELGLQMTSGALGEDVATRIRSGTGSSLLERALTGQGATGAELALEALADSAGVVVEAGPALLNASHRDMIDGLAERYVSEVKHEDAMAKIAELQQDKRALANRAKFDAEAEADAAVRALQDQQDGKALARGDQMEMPFGSGYGGGTTGSVFEGTPDLTDNLNPSRIIPEKDRVPTIVDMFSGESKAAPAIQKELDSRVGPDQMPEETDEAFEIRKQREQKAKSQIDRRQQTAFEDQKARELEGRTAAEGLEQDTFEGDQAAAEAERNQLAEDQTTLKNENRLLSNADITAEAKGLLARELEGVRRQKRGIANTPEKMAAVLAAYERKRLPELVANVRKRRTDLVTAARKRDIARENAKLREEQAAKSAEKFISAPRKDATIPRPAPAEGARSDLTHLLPGNQLKRAQTYTGKKDAMESAAQDLFEVTARGDSTLRGTQGNLTLSDSEAQGDLLGTGNAGYTGELSDDQAAAELAAGQNRRKTLTQKQKETQSKRTVEEGDADLDEAKAIDERLPEVQESLQKEKARRTSLTSKKYKASRTKAVNAIQKKALDEQGSKSDAVVAQEVTTAILEWEKANPAPPEPEVQTDEVLEKAKEIADKLKESAKTKETKKVNDAMRKKIAAGATPEEAAEAAKNEILTKTEDAQLRQELAGTLQGTPATAAMEAPAGWGEVDVSDPSSYETRYLRDALDAELRKPRPQLGGILRLMAGHPGTPRGYKWLANRLAPLVDSLGVALMPTTDFLVEKNYAGTFSPEENAVRIRLAYPVTFLHEALHAVTYNLIHSKVGKSNPKVAAAIKKLEAVLEAVNAHIAKNPRSAPARLNDAIANIDELLAHTMTENEIGSFMSTIPMPGQKGSTWAAFKSAVSSMFSPRTLGQYNALDAVIEAAGLIVEAQEENPGINAKANTSRKLENLFDRNRKARDLPQTITGNLGKTLMETATSNPLVERALGRARSLFNKLPEGPLKDFMNEAFNVPLVEMEKRTIAKGNASAYRKWRNELPRNLARWTPVDNKLILDNGVLMPLFHGANLKTSRDRSAFAAYRMPQDSEQLGWHLATTPVTSTNFNEDSAIGADANLLYLLVGRMSNPIRLHDFGLWSKGNLVKSLKKSRNEVLGRGENSLDFDRLLNVMAGTPAAEDAAMRQVFEEAGFDGAVYLNRYEIPGLISSVFEEALIRLKHYPKLKDLADTFLKAGMFRDWEHFNKGHWTIHSPTWAQFSDSLSDADFSRIFPEAPESYILFDASDAKSVTDNNGDWGENTNMFAQSATALDPTGGMSTADPTVTPEFTNVGPISIRPEWKNKKTFAGAVVDAFSSGAGGLKKATEIIERSQSEVASLTKRAEELYLMIDNSLDRQAADRGIAPAEHRKAFIEDVEKYEAATGRLDKAGQARNIRNKYGRAGRAYFRTRRTIDALSRDILQQRLDDPTPFTREEAGIYRSIKENLGRYYTRTYATNVKGIGEKRAKDIKAAYDAVAKGSTAEKHQEGYRIVRRAMDFIRDKVLAIPDTDELEAMPLVKLQALADAWGVTPRVSTDLENPLTAESRREGLIAGLEKFVNATPEAKERKALKLVLEALNRSDSTIMNYYRGAKQDRTVVTEREQVPEPIRKLLGEFEDLPLRGMLTTIKLAEFRARNAALNQLLETERGGRIMTQEEYDASEADPDEWRTLKGPGYGILNGMRVRKDLAGKLEDSSEVSRTFEQVWNMADQRQAPVLEKFMSTALGAWAKTAGQIKAVQLVWNVGNAFFNFLGGPISMLSNGNINPVYAARAFKTGWDLINAARGNGTLSKDMEKVIRSGITDSAFMGEIRAVELEQLRQLTEEAFKSETGKKASAIKQTYRGGKRMWRETYAMADVVWKIANFYAEEKKLQDFYKAEGVTKTDEQIEREAAWRTNLSNFSYKRVPNILKVAEKGGFTYVMPYIYETMRAPVGSMFVGVHDLKLAANATTPEGKRQMALSGMKRVAGSLMSLGIAQHLIQMVLESMTDDEEDDWVDKMKEMLPEYKKFSDYLYMGRNEEGKPVLFETSRLDPFGPVTEFYRMAVAGAEPEEMLGALKNLWINNPYGESILTAFFGDNSLNTRMERIDPANTDRLISGLTDVFDAGGMDTSTADAAARRTVKAVDALFPSMPLNIFDPNNKNAEGDAFGWAITNLLGVKVHTVDPAVTAQYSGQKFKAEQDSVRDAFSNFLKTSVNLEDNDIIRRWTDLQGEEAENYEKMADTYDALMDLGYEPGQALAMLKAGGVSENDLAITGAGGYRPEYSGIVNMSNLEQSVLKTVQTPSIPDDKKQRYIDNILKLVSLVEQGELPARSK